MVVVLFQMQGKLGDLIPGTSKSTYSFEYM
jgi:hypothetical protein